MNSCRKLLQLLLPNLLQFFPQKYFIFLLQPASHHACSNAIRKTPILIVLPPINPTHLTQLQMGSVDAVLNTKDADLLRFDAVLSLLIAFSIK